MKIAMITPGFLPVPAVQGGAVEVLIQYLIEGNEKKQNCHIDLYTTTSQKINEEIYNHTDIIKIEPSFCTKTKNALMNKIYQVFKTKKWRTSYGREVVKKIGSNKYDYVVIHNNLMAYRDIYEKTNNKDNLIYVAHNNVNDGDENHKIIAELIAKTAVKILTVSEYLKKQFLQICDTKNIDVFYNCIDLEKYSKCISEAEKNSLRKKYGIKKDDFVFIFSGRLDIYKGILELVKAFNRIKKDNIKLLIVGKSWFDDSANNDSFTEELKIVADESKKNIVFTGFIKPSFMPKVYQASDCLVVPSIWEEPFGVVALEGMASKLPLIVTNSGGLMEIVDENCSYIIDKGNSIVDNLEKVMRAVLEETQISKEKGVNAYDKLLKRKEFHKENYYNTFCEKIGL